MINDNVKITYRFGICDDETGALEPIGDTAVAPLLSESPSATAVLTSAPNASQKRPDYTKAPSSSQMPHLTN